MNIEKGSVLYFAENDYLFLKDIVNPLKYKDRTLLMCEQCVEKYMKHILKEELQEINASHNISYIHRRVSEVVLSIRNYADCVRFLRECYFDRNYENDVYYELSDEEFNYEYNRAIELIELLREHIYNNNKNDNSFVKPF